ncbi:MAG TPA: hypothetical protein VNM90_03635, partial [Haliangium sp.]|nr:hypothetical protein [Haliangium sp.]
MLTRARFGFVIGICLGIGACGGGEEGGSPDAAAPDASPPDAAIPDAMPIPDAATNPESLRETGLYSDFDNEVLAPGVREFEPQFELWSDGAEKRRFVYLPPNTTIDTSDMDYWVYPVGTRLWKEFWRDGVRAETRLLYKIRPGFGAGSWRMTSFAWNAEQTEADAEPGGDDDVLGTDHDIPPLVECLKCHGGVTDVALGFSAVMLDHDGEGVTLSDLIKEGKLSSPPAGSGSPYFPLPGNADEQAALGYLHGNCGSCHNPESDVFTSGDALMNLRLFVNQIATVQGSPAFTTAVCGEMQKPIPDAQQIIVPGQPDVSAMFMRMNQRNTDDQMPELASDEV